MSLSLSLSRSITLTVLINSPRPLLLLKSNHQNQLLLSWLFSRPFFCLSLQLFSLFSLFSQLSYFFTLIPTVLTFVFFLSRSFEQTAIRLYIWFNSSPFLLSSSFKSSSPFITSFLDSILLFFFLSTSLKLNGKSLDLLSFLVFGDEKIFLMLKKG